MVHRPSPYVYLPFGLSHRMCIGRVFALVSSIMCLYHQSPCVCVWISSGGCDLERKECVYLLLAVSCVYHMQNNFYWIPVLAMQLSLQLWHGKQVIVKLEASMNFAPICTV